MAKSKKKKYKKKKNPNRAPQKQNNVARTQSAPSGGQATDPKRQRQMWIALAIAVGVFLLLILVARLANRSGNQDAETTPETETVESGDEATESGDETEAVEDAAAQDNDAADAATSDNADTEQATATTDDVTTTAQNNAAGTTDNADTTAATDDNADTTAQSTATNDSTTTTAAQDNAASATTTNDAAATETASLQSADTETPAAEQYADILVQDYGKITVKLDPAAAPITVKNFTDLANDGFYNGLTFHRIMDGFMMQGGDPLGNGFGGSDENIVGEFSANGYANPLSHTRGAISMARGGDDMNSASSQFFIVQSDSTFLDGSYAAFGYVTSGMEIVDKICKDAKPTDDNGSIPPDEQPIIESITIREQ